MRRPPNPKSATLLVACLFLVSSCGFVEEQAGIPAAMRENPSSAVQDAQTYAQGAQDAATCAANQAPNSAPARMAAASAREADEARAAAASAAADLAAKRAAADQALKESKAAEEVHKRSHANVMATQGAFNDAVAARDKVFMNGLTPAERNAYTKAGQLSDEANARARSTPEYIATQKAVNDRHREVESASNESSAAWQRWFKALNRAEDARAEVDKADQAARAASDKAYTSMVASRQHAVNASRNCSHVAGIEQPQSSPTGIFGPLIPGMSIGIGGGFGGGGRRGGSTGSSGEGHK
jgi:hypothetical protein